MKVKVKKSGGKRAGAGPKSKKERGLTAIRPTVTFSILEEWRDQIKKVVHAEIKKLEKKSG